MLITSQAFVRTIWRHVTFRAGSILLRDRKSAPRVGHLRFGDLRRVRPLDPFWGHRRGGPLDRYYIERFLASHAEDIRGCVLEVQSPEYTRQFGGGRVVSSDVLDVTSANAQATLLANLEDPEALPPGAYDCVILTQTLQYVFEVRTAVATLYHTLKPGGVALVTVPGITKVESDATWYWSFSAVAVQKLFGEVFPRSQLEVKSHGNVLAAIGFLHGVGRGELTRAELDADDPDYPVIITVRVAKPEERS